MKVVGLGHQGLAMEMRYKIYMGGKKCFWSPGYISEQKKR